MAKFSTTSAALAISISLGIIGCADDTQTGAPVPVAPSQNSQAMERALIIGSAEYPDPVLTRVREMEKSGVVKDVVVLESFPVQIRLSASRQIVDELNTIPRVGGLR
jgi:hypothetical protein